MLEKLFDMVEGREEAQTVMDFLAIFAPEGDTEELFLAAVRDSRLAGFKEGIKMAMELQRECA